MSQEASPPELPWPRWHFDLNRWTIFLQTGLSLVGIIVPFLIAEVSVIFHVLVAITFILVPVSAVSLGWLCRAVSVALKRVIGYPRLFKRTSSLLENLALISKRYYSLIDALNERRRFDVQFAGINSNNRMYIGIKRKRSPVIAIGDRFEVITTDEELPKGIFEITLIRQGDYVAEAPLNEVDGNWVGYIVEQNAQIPVPPYFQAILISGGER